MIRWTIFAIVSIMWIATCWFFGSMVALTDSGPGGSIARQQCAQRLLREAGGQGDYQALYPSEQCDAAGRAASDELARPALRNGLLIGFVPVLLAGGVMLWRRRA